MNIEREGERERVLCVGITVLEIKGQTDSVGDGGRLLVAAGLSRYITQQALMNVIPADHQPGLPCHAPF